MDTIYANYSISMSEFKKNPAQVLRAAGGKPVAVLSHNRPAFYMVTPQLFESLVEELAIGKRERLAAYENALKGLVTKRVLGTLGAKASVTFKPDFSLTDEEFLQA